MKNNAEFEHAFREKLGQHAEAPPPGMWEAISASLPPHGRPRRRGAIWFGLAGMLLFVGLGLGLWLFEDSRLASTTQARPLYSGNPTELAGLSIPVVTKPGKAAGVNELAPKSAMNKAAASHPVSAAVRVSAQGNQAEASSIHSQPKTAQIPEASSSVEESTQLTHYPISSAEVLPDAITEPAEQSKPTLYSNTLSDSLLVDSALIDPAITARSFRRLNRPDYILGAYYLPEFGSHSLQSGSQAIWSQGAGLRLGVEYRRIGFESGLALARSSDKWNYKVDYLSRDSVGWYWDVVTVSFIALTNLQGDTIGWEPQYNCVQANYYDSILHSYTETLRGSYTYYQIPLLVSYRGSLEMSQALRYNIKAGVIYNRVTRSIEPSPSFDASDVRVLQIVDESYLRRHSYFQWVASAELRYGLGQRLSLFAEPMLRYSMDPIYLTENQAVLARPISFSLRGGLLWTF